MSAAAPSAGLGTIAAKNGFVFGAAAGPVIDKDAAYRELYTTHTENYYDGHRLKMGTSRRSRDRSNSKARIVCCNFVRAIAFRCAAIA